MSKNDLVRMILMELDVLGALDSNNYNLYQSQVDHVESILTKSLEDYVIIKGEILSED